MNRFDGIDFFADASLINDPYPYFEYLREAGPVTRMPGRNVVAVTGYEEGLAVLWDHQHFSSIQAVSGPIPPLPFIPQGDDITEQLELHRGEMAYAALLATLDPPVHTELKHLLMGMFTPKRLQENEVFMLKLADRILDEIFECGSFEVNEEYGRPYATLVIADLLGVPEEDHREFTKLFGSVPGQIDGTASVSHDPLASIGMYFSNYIEDRRQNPRQDVLTKLALAKLKDGTLPPTPDVVTLATFVFGAGQDTSVKLFAAMLRFVADDPALQQKLRENRALIPDFIEEVLRLEGSIKTVYRVAKVPVKVGDVEVSPGTTVMMALGAMNRDPRRFEDPYALKLGRKNVRDQLAFSRGIHSCVGAPLARAEARITLERLFDRTTDIEVDALKHGPIDARRYEFEPTYLMRGVRELYVNLKAAS